MNQVSFIVIFNLDGLTEALQTYFLFMFFLFNFFIKYNVEGLSKFHGQNVTRRDFNRECTDKKRVNLIK